MIKRILLISIFVFNIVAYSARANITEIIKNEYVPSLEKALLPLQGSAVSIIYNGEVIYQNTFGYTAADGKKITANTLFPLASCTKPIVGTVIAQLVKDKIINIDDK